MKWYAGPGIPRQESNVVSERLHFGPKCRDGLHLQRQGDVLEFAVERFSERMSVRLTRDEVRKVRDFLSDSLDGWSEVEVAG